MLWPFPGNTRITAGFDDPRPMSSPGKHKHGAIDIGTAEGSQIVAPEKGELFYYFGTRPHDSMYWPQGEMKGFPYRNYFYDMYGALLILKGQSGITHIFTHIYMNQIFNKENCEWAYYEEKLSARFPLFCFKSNEVIVYEGAKIGVTGNSGYSTAPHCHYELHKGFIWQDWADRPNPEKINWKNFQ